MRYHRAAANSDHRPSLVNVSSFRNIIAFAITFKTIDWLDKHGYLTIFAIYAGVTMILGLTVIPLLLIYGKRSRQHCARYVGNRDPTLI